MSAEDDGSGSEPSKHEEEACPGPGLQLAAREGQANPRPGKAHAQSVSSAPIKGLLSLAISFAYSRPCKCCLCGSLSTDATPLMGEVTEAADPEFDPSGKRPWAKYRKVETPEGPMRVPEGRCCLPCFNVFRCLGRAGVSSVSGDPFFDGLHAQEFSVFQFSSLHIQPGRQETMREIDRLRYASSLGENALVHTCGV